MTVKKLARAISMKGRLLVCVLWLAFKRTDLASDGFACFRKCSNHTTKMWDCIHPVSCAIAIDAGGARSINSSFILFLGKMNNDSINDPAALMQISTVTSCPFSADDHKPTCFFPRLAIILDSRLGTVIIPVSSTLGTRSGINLFAPYTVSSRSMNALTAPG